MTQATIPKNIEMIEIEEMVDNPLSCSICPEGATHVVLHNNNDDCKFFVCPKHESEYRAKRDLMISLASRLPEGKLGRALCVKCKTIFDLESIRFEPI